MQLENKGRKRRMGRERRLNKGYAYQHNQGNWVAHKPRLQLILSVCQVVDSRRCNSCYGYMTLPFLVSYSSVEFSQPTLLLRAPIYVFSPLVSTWLSLFFHALDLIPSEGAPQESGFVRHFRVCVEMAVHCSGRPSPGARKRHCLCSASMFTGSSRRTYKSPYLT